VNVGVTRRGQAGRNNYNSYLARGYTGIDPPPLSLRLSLLSLCLNK
jgi:hypothetical protein